MVKVRGYVGNRDFRRKVVQNLYQFPFENSNKIQLVKVTKNSLKSILSGTDLDFEIQHAESLSHIVGGKLYHLGQCVR